MGKAFAIIQLSLEGWAAWAFCQFKQKACSLWMQESDVTTASTDTIFLIDERNFFSLQVSKASFDVVDTKCYMLETILAAVCFSMKRAIGPSGVVEPRNSSSQASV